jgi:anti-sigma factor RsiW
VNLDDIACAELVERITDLLEGVLPPEEEAAISAHVEGCAGCAAAIEQFRRTVRVLGELRHDDVRQLPPDVVEGLVEALRRRPG